MTLCRGQPAPAAQLKRWVKMDSLIVTALVSYLPEVNNRDIVARLSAISPSMTRRQPSDSAMRWSTKPYLCRRCLREDAFPSAATGLLGRLFVLLSNPRFAIAHERFFSIGAGR